MSNADYIANRQSNTDWVVLPPVNFDAYFGRGFSYCSVFFYHSRQKQYHSRQTG